MRFAEMHRKTNETEIRVFVHLDGETPEISVRTGIGFLDHMLTLFAFHGRFGLKITACGDLQVDAHHTVEDVGTVLGYAFDQALGNRSGIRRYGFSILPMDEVLVRAAVDVSGRPFLHLGASFSRVQIGQMYTEDIREFFAAFVRGAKVTLHLDVLRSGNEHHQAEAMFKAFGQALNEACRREGAGIPSTKGKLV